MASEASRFSYADLVAAFSRSGEDAMKKVMLVGALSRIDNEA